MQANRTQAKTLLATTLCHVIWGFSFLAARRALESTELLTLLSHRFLLAFLLMHLFPRRLAELKRLGRQQLLWLAVLGVMDPILYFSGEQLGLVHSTSIFSGVMIAMIPVVSTLAAAPILKERPTLGQVLFSLLSVAGVVGVALLSGSAGRPELIGVIALTVAVLSAAAYTLISRKMAAEISPFIRTYAIMATGAVFFTALALVRCGGDLSAWARPLAAPSYAGSVVFLSAFCSVLCYVLSGYAISRLPVARESVFANLTTAVSVFVGAVFLQEAFTWGTVACCLLILVGIWGVQKFARQ